MENQKIIDIIARTLRLDPKGITVRTKLYEDLGADSLTVCRIVIEIEETFDVALDMESFISDASVGDLVEAVLAARRRGMSI